jgi:peptidoglycan hydrolase-like protein with peptidoglycan-binding domain
MAEHSFYADHLVDVLLEEGIPANQIWELDGWKDNEQRYYWTDIHTNRHNGYDGVANGHLNHHTASKSYVPFVKNTAGQTKATAWLGVRDGGRLYQNRSSGVPTIVLASAGPADYSAGSGVRDYIKKLDASTEVLRQMRRDDYPKFYGNRYVLNTEIVCDGVGGSINDDSWDLLVVYNAALSRLHDAGPAWNGFHQGFTGRKIDFRDGRFANASMTIGQMWVEIAAVLSGTSPAPEPPPEEEENMYIEVKYGDGFRASPEMKPAVAGWQGTTKLLGNPDGNSGSASGVDGVFGNGTKAATKLTQAQIGVPVTGIADKDTRLKAERYLIDHG